MHYRTIPIAITVAVLGVGSAYAQELSELQVCEAAAAAFQAYGVNNGDADSAKNMVAQGLAACKSGKTAEGIDMINTAIGAISDGKEGSHRNKG